MPSERRFVVCGWSKLAALVASDLAASGHAIEVLYEPHDAEHGAPPHPVERVTFRRVEEALPTALTRLDLRDVACVLGLSPHDETNLLIALACHETSPTTPVVMRAFDQSVARSLERGRNVRRAYSVSALAAPAMVGEALSEQVLATLNLSRRLVLVCRLTVHPDGHLVGRRLDEIDEACRVLWKSVDDEVAKAGTVLVVGGLLDDVLAMARDNGRPPRPAPAVRPGRRRARRRRTLVGRAALALATLLLVAVIVFKQALGLSLVDAIYFVTVTATTVGYGDFSLRDAPAWVKLFGCGLLFIDTALIAVLFSYLAAYMTADRIEEHMGQRARRLNDHAVVAGLGNVGYRVQALFEGLGIPTVVIEQREDVRFVEAVRERSVVLVGDASLPENLHAAGIERARYFVACTDQDMANIQASMQARDLNPDLRTVTRVANPMLARMLTATFDLDVAIHPAQVASPAFVGAALDPRAPRDFVIDGVKQRAMRHVCEAPVTAETVTEWSRRGILILAWHDQDGLVRGGHAASLPAGASAVIAGPLDGMRDL